MTRTSHGAFTCLTALLCILPLDARVAAAEPLAMTCGRGLVSVRTHGERLQHVLRELTRACGVEFVRIPESDVRVSIEIVDEPIGRALASILTGFDYVIVDAGDAARDHWRVWLRASSAETRAGERQASNARSASAAVATADEGDGAVHEAGDAPAPEHDPETSELETSGFFENAEPAALLEFARASANPSVRARALKALAARDTPHAAAAFGQGVADPDPQVSAAASELLADLPDEAALDALSTLLEHDTDAVRFAALELLGRRGEASALPAIRLALDDPNEAIQLRASALVQAITGSRERR